MFAVDTSEILKNYAQVAVAIGAGGYFLAKLALGYLVIDFSVTVSCDRQNSLNDKEDHLAVNVNLAKGDRGTFQPHDGLVLVTQNDRVTTCNIRFERFNYSKGRKLQVLQTTEKELLSRPNVNFAPGESTQLSFWLNVDRDSPCLVEVIVIGTGFSSPYVSQWKASTVSLPCKQFPALNNNC